ncbi:hypothetical protein [Streptomyces sp. NPDC092952]|uniref:hypothetical protein n=1 Tax=Streptomyces sp. NPDC092952 TaxID=3366018 RepID=UPI00381388CA
MRIRIGNMTIDTTDDNAVTGLNENAAQIEGGTVVGGHFGGENHGITGGTIHGNVTFGSDDR